MASDYSVKGKPSEPAKMTAIGQLIDIAYNNTDSMDEEGLERIENARIELAALLKCREACRKDRSLDGMDQPIACLNADAAATEAGL